MPDNDCFSKQNIEVTETMRDPKKIRGTHCADRLMELDQCHTAFHKTDDCASHCDKENKHNVIENKQQDLHFADRRPELNSCVQPEQYENIYSRFYNYNPYANNLKQPEVGNMRHLTEEISQVEAIHMSKNKSPYHENMKYPTHFLVSPYHKNASSLADSFSKVFVSDASTSQTKYLSDPCLHSNDLEMGRCNSSSSSVHSDYEVYDTSHIMSMPKDEGNNRNYSYKAKKLCTPANKSKKFLQEPTFDHFDHQSSSQKNIEGNDHHPLALDQKCRQLTESTPGLNSEVPIKIEIMDSPVPASSPYSNVSAFSPISKATSTRSASMDYLPTGNVWMTDNVKYVSDPSLYYSQSPSYDAYPLTVRVIISTTSGRRGTLAWFTPFLSSF